MIAVVTVHAIRPTAVLLTASGSPAAGTVGTHTAELLAARLVRRVDAHDLHCEVVQGAQRAAQLRLIDELSREHRVPVCRLDRHPLQRPDEQPRDLAPDNDPIQDGLPAAAGRNALLQSRVVSRDEGEPSPP